MATSEADDWLGRDASELLLKLRVDGGRVQIEELESGETSYTWNTWNPVYTKQVVTEVDRQVVGMTPGGRGVAGAPVFNETVHTKDMYVPATHRCDVRFYADMQGIVRRWEYSGSSCRHDIKNPKEKKAYEARITHSPIMVSGSEDMKTGTSIYLVAMAPAFVLAETANAAGPRFGEVVVLAPIDNRGDDESLVTKSKRKIGRALGGLAGMGILGSGNGGTTGVRVDDSADEIGETMATKIGDQGPTTRYMVKVRMDGGKVMSLAQLGRKIEGIQVGTRVRMEGSGDSALIYAE